MEISIKTITLFTAVLLTGLSAGFFYAWAVSVIPGARRVGDMAYLEAMQAINRAILNPAFFLIFFGSLAALAVSAVQQQQSGLTFWLALAAAITYLLGTFGVTVFGNVPLNDALDALSLHELTPDKITSTRSHYEIRWNRLHMARTLFAVLSFILALSAVFTSSKIL